MFSWSIFAFTSQNTIVLLISTWVTRKRRQIITLLVVGDSTHQVFLLLHTCVCCLPVKVIRAVRLSRKNRLAILCKPQVSCERNILKTIFPSWKSHQGHIVAFPSCWLSSNLTSSIRVKTAALCSHHHELLWDESLCHSPAVALHSKLIMVMRWNPVLHLLPSG